MSRHTILLLDTAFSAAPIYDALSSLEADLYVMGGREGDVLARRAGDRWINQDYSDVAAVEAWLAHNHCTLVVPGCTDVSLSVASAVGASPFIDPPEITAYFCDKSRFRQLCRDLALPAPAVVSQQDFPLPGLFICKPIDAFSGRGVVVFDGGDRAATESALRLAQNSSPTGQIIVEEFIDGQLYSYSAFLDRNKVCKSFLVKEGSSANHFAVDTSFVVHDAPASVERQLTRCAERIAAHLALKDGLLHIQFILRGHDVFLIEAMRRCPGDLYALLIEYSTGYPYAAHYASAFLGRGMEERDGRTRFIVRHTVSALQSAVNVGLRFQRPVNLQAFFPLQRLGETMLANQKTRSGIAFADAGSARSAADLYDAFVSRSVYAD